MKRRKKGKPKKKDAATASKQTLRPQRLTLLQKVVWWKEKFRSLVYSLNLVFNPLTAIGRRSFA